MNDNDHQSKKVSNFHQPVLLNEVLESLNPQKGESYLDLTAGYGGHADAILNITKSPQKATLVDRDSFAIDFLKEKFGDSIKIIKSDFLNFLKARVDEVSNTEDELFDIILIDLGVSSPQLDNADRGFSFQKEAVLDMRMDREQSYSALDFVNKERVDLIADTLFKYGDEHLSKKIAKEIIKNRPIKTTTQLAEICQLAYKKGYYKTHPATKTFQAIRIYVNNELEQLEESLAYASRLLNPGGRLGIITFHSIEDRIVKNFFKFNSNTLDSDYITDNSGGLQKHKKFGTLKLVSEDLNPRARSAKLRVLRVKK